MLKKQLATLAVAICVCSLIAGLAEGTSAYFAAEEKAHNVITTGGIDIELTEWMEDENGNQVPFGNVKGVMPGAAISKIAVVENRGQAEAYIRVRVDKYLDNADTSLSDSVITINFNTTNWTEKDGYYYYNEVLEPGETTEPVFTSVTFDKSMGNEYQNATATVDVSAQATQVDNNGDSALTAKGWPGK